VIPRLRLSRYDRTWTELFKATQTLRPLRVMVDVELMTADSAIDWTPEAVLTGFLTHEDIELWRYADGGPPPGTPTLNWPGGPEYAIGWVAATTATPGGLISHDLVWSDGKTATAGAITGNGVDVASRDTSTTAYASLTPAEASVRRTADAVAACAAQELKADIYVTNRSYLHALNWSLAGGVTFCSPSEALTLVSLYLRSQGEFLIWKDPTGTGSERFNKGLFYWVGARELLPAGWRWFAACVAHDQAHGSDDLIYLGGALFQRLIRALQARDGLLCAMNRIQDNDVAENALTALDTCLVFLMGALDAAARVAHHVLLLPPADLYKAGWQGHRNWLKHVAATAPDLAAVVGPGTIGLDTLTILRLLRNTVHAAGLKALAVSHGGAREETLVGLPRADRAEILAAADRRGGREAWGLREVLPGELHADPGLLLERLLPAVSQLLNELMTATPVERLGGVALKPDDFLPPAGDHQPFAARERQSIRWQLGL
jgi:hypothetical protein